MFDILIFLVMTKTLFLINLFIVKLNHKMGFIKKSMVAIKKKSN